MVKSWKGILITEEVHEELKARKLHPNQAFNEVIENLLKESKPGIVQASELK